MEESYICLVDFDENDEDEKFRDIDKWLKKENLKCSYQFGEIDIFRFFEEWRKI